MRILLEPYLNVKSLAYYIQCYHRCYGSPDSHHDAESLFLLACCSSEKEFVSCSLAYTVYDNIRGGKLSRFVNSIHYVGKTFVVCPQSPILECVCKDNDMCAKYDIHRMAEELKTDNSVCEYHVYQDNWTPFLSTNRKTFNGKRFVVGQKPQKPQKFSPSNVLSYIVYKLISWMPYGW